MRKYSSIVVLFVFAALVAIAPRPFGVEADSGIEAGAADAGTWARSVTEDDIYTVRKLHSMDSDPTGGIVAVGSTDDIVWDDADGWIGRMDASGNLVTAKRIGGTNGDALYRLTRTSDGGWIAGGGTNSFGSQHWGGDAWVCKLDSNLKVTWQKAYRSTLKYRNDSVQAICQTQDGGYVVLTYDSFYTGEPSLMKLDSAGNVLWCKLYEDSYEFDMNSPASNLVPLDDGGVVIAGGSYDGYVLRVDMAGNLVWKRWIKGRSNDDDEDSLSALVATTDGGIVVAGSTTTYSDEADGWLFKLDSTGSLLWQYRYKGTDSWKITDTEELPDGSILLSAAGTFDSQQVLQLLRVSAVGKLTWYRMFDLFESYHYVDYRPRISTSSDGSIGMIVGESNEIVRFTATGEIVASCKPTKWKLKTYKTQAVISAPDITVTDFKMKKLNMNAKMYDLDDTVSDLCQ